MTSGMVTKKAAPAAGGTSKAASPTSQTLFPVPPAEAPSPVPLDLSGITQTAEAARNSIPKEKKGPMSIGEMLISSPDALAAIANLLFPPQKTIPQSAAPLAGGQSGQVVPGFSQLPQGLSIGEILNALPRMQ